MPTTEMQSIILTPHEAAAIPEGGQRLLLRVVTTEIPADADEVFVWPRHEVLPHHRNPGLWARKGDANEDNLDGWIRFLGKSPYGHPGYRLWCRETWQYRGTRNDQPNGPLTDDCTQTVISYAAAPDAVRTIDGSFKESPNWFSEGNISSTHMPRWASRTTIEIVEVRVKQFQNITFEDIAAGGFPPDNGPMRDGTRLTANGRLMVFAEMWDDNNPKHPAASNPWVWALTFKVM